MTQKSIIIKNLSKSYKLYHQPIDRLKESLHPFRKTYHKDFFALSNVNLEIDRGATVGVIGKNGAGKSTLLKIITGVLTPSSGHVKVKGKISAILELGTGFNPELTGMENIYFAGTIMGNTREEIQARLDDIIAFADIGEYMDQPVKTYSSGMFARLAFAVAVSVDPEILIVDETLAVGDMNFQAKCFAKFKEFKKKKKTILFVSHSLDSIIRFCDRAVFIDHGKKILEDDPKSVIDAYKKSIVDVKSASDKKDESNDNVEDISKNASRYRDLFTPSEHLKAYGDGRAEIVDFGLFDADGKPSQKLFNGDWFHVKMKVKFNEGVPQPIFAFTIKDLKGLEITGTNTHYERVDTGDIDKGRIVEVKFSQKMLLNSGSFALSLGCTNFENDRFVVYSRLYDVLLFEVISHKHMVGLFSPESSVTIS